MAAVPLSVETALIVLNFTEALLWYKMTVVPLWQKCYKTSSLSYLRVKCLVVFMSYLAPAACNLNDVSNKN